MKKITQKWLEFAKKDIKDAEILFKGRSYEASIWHCHQACEKTLKAIIVEKNIRLRKTHDLVGLSEDAKINLPKNISEFIDNLNPYYNPIRYPDVFLESKLAYSRPIAQTILKITKEVSKWIKTLIQ